MPDLSVSVVVCAYTEDRWDDLVAAVDSARRQDPPPAEIILVVDHNRSLFERAADALQASAASADLIVVENAGPRGLSGARNTGIAAARGGIVAFLDDDARAEPGWLAALVAPYRDPGVIGTGGHAEARWDAGRPAWFPVEFDWVVGCSYRGLPSRAAPVRNPLGCNMSFRRAVFEEVGAFRPEVGRVGRVPVGCEETELSVRALARWPAGRILYLPDAVVHHRVPADRSRFAYFRSRCHAEGRSKALVTHFAGQGRALGTERAYALRVLPRGVVRGLADLLRGDGAGLLRAASIVLGLSFTTAGYATGRILLGIGRTRPSPGPADTIPARPAP